MAYVKSPVELGLATDCQGIYIQTTDDRIKAMLATQFLDFGVGDTRVDAKFSTIASRMRGHTSSKNPAWQQHLLDSIPNPGYRDYALHKEIRQTFATQLEDPDSGKRNELFRVAVEEYLIEEFVKTNDFEPVRQWLSEKLRKCAAKLNPSHSKQSVLLRNIQTDVIKKVLSVLRANGLVTNFVCELAARIGKTILFLSLAKRMQEEFGHQSMFVMAYGVGLSVKTSYQDEIEKYSDFANMEFINASDSDAEDQFKQAIANSKMPIVFVSLNPDAEEKYEWINQLTGIHIALLEETDFGTHTDSQVAKVDYILANKTVTRINASGTNIGRVAKAFGKNAIDEIISIPYCMVEQDESISDRVVRKFYNMLYSGRINKLLENFDEDLLPNITKILSKPNSQQKFISALFEDIFGYQPIYGFNINECAGVDIQHSMLFVNITKDAMDRLADIIEKACTEHKVLILNGDYTDNKSAEGLTKEELVRLQNNYYPGRTKLLVITNMMGTRSYSIPEIQACLFMQEGGDVYPYMQKYSRCLTPGFGKKFGHIFDFAFDQSKTRNSVMSVAVEAALLIRQKGKTYPEAVREVLNSVNIKDMVSGQWMDADTIIKAFEDNNKLLEIANAHTRITIEDLTSEEIEAFGELAKRSSSSKAEKSKIDKVIATGKTFDSGNVAGNKAKKDPLKAVVEKATRMINGSATTILALCNYQGESFLECIDLIDNNVEMSTEFLELYGVTPATVERLKHRLEIPTLDMIVRMSKYNATQKHIENNALAILKDDAKLWFEIFGNRELKRFIKSKHCKRILVVAGGHGSEIDVLVDMFGIDIIDKIVYNDKYSFLCNQVKRKYPNITIAKGNFLNMEFNMKFDVIVGNPPYQVPNAKTSGGSGTLWKKFVSHVFDLVKTDGYVAFVTPVCPYYTKDSIGQKFRTWQTHAIWTDQSKYFPKIGSTFTSWIVQNTPKYKLTSVVDLGYDIDLATARYRLLPPIANQILAKLDAGKKSLGTYKVYGDANTTLSTTYSAQTPYKVRWASIKTNNGYRYTNFPGAYYTHSKVAMSFSGNPDFKYFDGKSDPIGSSAGMSGYILVKDAAEGANLIDSINLSINKFERKLLKSSGAFTNAYTWQTIAFDIKQPVTDTQAFAVIGLTADEEQYVKDFLK